MDALKKMDDHQVHATPNHHPTKMDVLPKTFLQINLAAKYEKLFAVFKYWTYPPTSSDDLCLLFCIFPSSMCWVLYE